MAISDYVRKFFEPKANEVRVRDVVRELPTGVGQTAKKISDYFIRSGQASFRGFSSFGTAVTGRPLTPSTTFQKSLYGTDQPITPTSYGQEFGLKGKFAAVGGAVLPALDLIPGGKISKATAIKLLQEANDTETALKVFKQLMGVSDDVAKKFAPLAAEITDAERIGKIVSEAIGESQSVGRITAKIAGGAKNIRERGFVTSVKEIIPDADKVAGVYIPRSTSQLAIKARNFILENLAEAERIALTEATDKAVAIASELIKKYGDDAEKAADAAQASAFYDKAASIANTLAPKLTEQGRAIQAASILGRLTPEGQIRFAAREIQRFNEENPLKRIPELTGEQMANIRTQMKEFQQMPEGLEKAMKFNEIQNYIADLVPTPLIKKVIAVWKAGLLTGIKTTGLNLFSNLTHAVTETAKDLPASIVDSAASLFTGERTKTMTIRKAFEGMKEGSIKGKRYFSTGYDERNIGAKIDYKRVNFGKGPVAKAFQLYTDTIFRSLAVGDQPFYYAALSRSLMDQALAAGKNAGLKGKELVEYAYSVVESPTEEMIRFATSDASTAVFINETLASKAASKIQSLPGGEFVIPFGRTPSAVGMQAIAYSPIGLAATIIKNIGKGKFNQREFSQGIGRGLTGTAVMAIGMELAKKGLVSGTYPLGDEKEQELQKAEGQVSNRILIDGKWRNPLVLGPAGTVLLAGANLEMALQKAGSPTEAMAQAAAATGKSFLELPFLTGLQDAINAVMDPARYAAGYLPNLIASFIPTIVSDIARAKDTVERQAITITEKIKSRLPVLRETLQPKVDILGREQARGGNILETMADPTRPSKDVGTVVTNELRRLTDSGFRVSPTMLGDKNGFKALSKSENTELWKLTGTILNGKLQNLFASPQYKRLSDEEKAKVVEDFVNKSRVVARATTAIKLTDGLSGDALKKKLSELKAGGLLTKEVYAKYLELR